MAGVRKGREERVVRVRRKSGGMGRIEGRKKGEENSKRERWREERRLERRKEGRGGSKKEE